MGWGRRGGRAEAWTLRRRMLTLTIGVALLLGLLGGIAASLAAFSRQQVTAVVENYSPLWARSEELLAALVSQETGIRGYALTGDPADLAPYTEGVREEERLAAEMSRPLSQQDGARERLTAVRDAAARWRADVAEPVIAAVGSGGPEAAQPLVGNVAREQFEGVRTRVTAFQEEILRLRDEAAARATEDSGVLVLLLVAAAAVMILAGAVLVVLQQRLVVDPVTRLAAEVRLVARGDYEHEISGTGPPELARLSRDVDGMRRKIARELADVVAARRRIEEINATLEAQAAELTRSNRDLEQFAYVASHDLQEPLRKVASFCQLLQRRYAGQLDERADQYIAFAVNGAQRMQRLINDLLAFSRIGRATAGFRPVDLNRVAEETVASLDSMLERTGAEVTLTDLPAVRGEEVLLGTLLSNLIGNSVKFRRPDVPPRVTLSARRDGEFWELSCVDNGIGVEAEYAEKIFVIFQRLHPRDAYPGTGIGLAIAKKIVEYHGGQIWLDPESTVGTTIRFTLPVPEESSA
jgi:signal transduction histidine kinase